MSRKEQKRKRKREKRRLASCEHQSDRRTAEFLVRRIGEVQEELADLLTEFRAFDHFTQIEYAALCLRIMDLIKRRYERFADCGVWSEEK